MADIVESYKLGDISVTVSETDKPNRLHIECNDGTYHSEFTVSRYEHQHYKRHMNQKILKAYKSEYGER
ncbi:MAG: hypothetical protein WD355_11785 [Balneolaceae bacterium]